MKCKIDIYNQNNITQRKQNATKHIHNYLREKKSFINISKREKIVY